MTTAKCIKRGRRGVAAGKVIAAQLLTAPWPADGFARFLIVTSTGVVLASSVLTPATIVTNRLPAAGTYSVVIDPPGITT